MNKNLQFSCRQIVITLLLLILPLITVLAQTRRVTGRITFEEDGSAGSFVSVLVKGTTIGTTTNEAGDFSINVPTKEATLIFTLIGYERKEVIVSANQTVIKVSLVADNKQLEEVVVVGFGQQKKPTVTGAVTSISSKDLAQSPVANISNALAGRLPGLITQQQSGLPGGDAANLLIRGYGSFNTSSQSPLILVDGVERRFNDIDVNEIDNISILKDASSTAVFGVRGANGVIIVTTKRGQVGTPKVSMSMNQAFQTPTKLPTFLGSYDYATLYNEAFVNDGGDPTNLPYSASDLQKYKDGSSPYTHPDVDWYKVLFKNFAPQTQVNLNISGGTRIAKYYISGTFLDQEGLFKYAKFNEYNTNAKFTRFNFRSNVDFQLTKDFTASLTLGGRRSAQTLPGNGIFQGSVPLGLLFWNMGRWAPNLAPVFNPNGTLGAFVGDANLIGDLSRTGFFVNNRNDIELSTRLTHKLDFILKGLSARAQISFDTYYTGGDSRIKGYDTFKYVVDPITGKESYLTTSYVDTPLTYSWGGAGNISSFSTYRKMYAETALDWSGSIDKKHNFTALLLLNAERSRSGGGYPNSKLGLVGRVTYNHKERYFAEVNAGYNGTENFAIGRRMGFFPAFSAGWTLSNEDWFKNTFKFVNYLKFRGSYGKVGNAEIGGRRFLYLPSSWGGLGSANFGSPTAASTSGSYETAVGNPNVTWETAWKSNLGIEFNTLQNGLAITVDLFKEERTNILLTRQDIPNHLGYNSTAAGNWGAMENKGFEIETKYQNKVGSYFNYYFGGNVSFSRNKILRNTEPTRPYEWMQTVGKRYLQNYGLTSLGFFNSWDEIKNSPDQTTFGAIQPGDIKYKDLNGDKVINYLDVGPIGNPITPEINFGINAGFNYKGLDFSLLFQGSDNTNVFVSTQGGWDFYNSAKVMEHHLGRWTEQTKETATYPRLTVSSTSAKNNYQNSSFWLKDASYVRLKNAEIGYKFQPNVLKRIRLQAIRVYTNAQNLYTWSDLDWFDPEIRTSSASVYPQQKVFNVGLNVTF